MMSVIYRDPNEPEQKLIDGICMCVLYVIAFLTILFTFPGCQADDQRQQYQPFYAPPSKRPVEKIRKPIHDAATRVDDVLEKTPVPAVAEILVDNALETIEQIKPLPEPTAPDPEVIAIIEPEPDPFFIEPENYDELKVDETDSGWSTWIVVLFGLIALFYVCFKMLKGMSNVKDTERDGSPS